LREFGDFNWFSVIVDCGVGLEEYEGEGWVVFGLLP
jgi:hypothetical protein